MKDASDILLIETVTSVEHAEGALRATDGQGKAVWLAVSTDDFDGTVIRSGEPLAELAPVLAAHQVDAVLIN